MSQLQKFGAGSSCWCEIDMKIVAVLENTIKSGGGFNQTLNAIVQMQRICKGKYEFEVFTTRKENIEHLEHLGIKGIVFSFSPVDKLLSRLCFNALWQVLQPRLKIMGGFEKKLLRHGCDLVYFAAPTDKSAALQRINYILTVWDLCHRDMPEFPEVRDYNQFYKRESYYQSQLSLAVAVLADSDRLVETITRRYGIDRERLLTMPFAPAAFLESEASASRESVLKKYKLDEGYFFYPAQFWAHKNHIRILQALLILKNEGIDTTLVFAGGSQGDQGNREYIEQFVQQHALESQVRFLGFVAAEDMRGLYEGCRAVVMPTYFGPTNLPPLEAWLTGKPLIYSAHLAQQAGDAAILCDPDKAGEWALAIKSCFDPQLCAEMTGRGSKRLQEIEGARDKSELELQDILERYEERRSCWS
jgi:glycosyltransferase involved in cell wall biosynthesis